MENEANFSVENRGSYDSLDLMKCVLAFIIVAAHASPFVNGYEIVMFFARLALPLFFITSGYFFFRRVAVNPNDPEWEYQCLIRFLHRGLSFYVAWFIVSLPITILYWSWYGYSFSKTAILFLLNFPFGTTFFASWYLSAMLLGIILIVVLSRRLRNSFLLIIAFLFYLLSFVFNDPNLLQMLQLSLPAAYPNPSTSFPVAVIWLTFGKLFAENSEKLSAFQSKSPLYRATLLLLAVGFYILESKVNIRLGLSITKTVYLTLIPLCPLLFLLVRGCAISISCARELRAISTVTYCLHGSLVIGMRSVLKRFGIFLDSDLQCLVFYLSICLFCILASLIIYNLCRMNRFKWLRWFL